jgi:hypothetical protein
MPQRTKGRVGMLFGALGFSYAGFDNTARAMAMRGAVSCNLGDNMQSLAVRHLYAQLGVDEARIVRIDRDTIRDYDGPPVMLPMNACFYQRNLPLPPQITPIFIGFQARAGTIRAHRDWLAGHAPIGCRDTATADLLRAEGIAAEVTGCLTLSLPAREPGPRRQVLVVQGSGPGALPGLALRHMPKRLLARARFVFQRREVTEHPLSPATMAAHDRIAAALLQDYNAEAALVVTPLHHVAAPCIAAGIPVVLVRNDWDDRFSYLSDLLPIHLTPDFDTVDWSPAPVDVAAIKAAQLAQFRVAVERWL